MSYKVKILFISSNPRDQEHLNLKKEFKEIQDIIEKSPQRDLLELFYEAEVQPRELIELFLKYKPDILHFTGHSKSAKIFLINKQGDSTPVGKKALTDLFKELKGNMRIVFLNACYTAPQAKAIAQVVGCAIGITRDINDTTAIEFAASFYKMLASGSSVKSAFDASKTNLEVQALDKEAKYFKLIVGNTVEPSKIYLLKQSYKGDWLLSYPELWNHYVTILAFTKYIQHIFLTLDTQHLTDLITQLDEINRASDFQKVSRFYNSWNTYDTEYQKFFSELDYNFPKDGQVVIEGISKLKAVKEQIIQQILVEAQKYYPIIEQSLTEYLRIHKQASQLMAQDNLYNTLTNQNTANQIGSQFIDLEKYARSLVTDSDNLLIRLIEILLQK